MAKPKKTKPRRVSKKGKKRLDDFLLSEEGKIKKKDLAKLGVSLATLATMFQAQGASADYALPDLEQTEGGGGGHYSGHSNGSAHRNYFFAEQEQANVGAGGHMSGLGHASHASHASHGSHGSHASHGQW